ncbi:MAG: APC family permease, partial [Thermoanaerobaculia bacterium]|nr:APC family permease [Thermoanaerobaculia bacterium]
RDLHLGDIVSFGINSVVGTGIFFLPGEAAAMLGPAATLSFLIAAGLCSLLVLCFAEAGSRFRGTGGPILYAEAAFGPFAGFTVGWLMLCVRLVTWGALANAVVTSLETLVPGAETYRTAILVLHFTLLTAVNVSGVKWSARVTNFFTLAKLLPMFVFAGVGLFFLDTSFFRPFAPHGYTRVGAGTLLLLFAFVGFEVLAVAAGEMKRPERDVPLGLFGSMGVITAIYLLIWVVCVGTLPTLAGSASPVAEAAPLFLGRLGGSFVAVGILMSVIGVNLAVSVVASRCLYALADDAHLPRYLARVHAGTGAPVPAIVATAALALAISLSGTYVELAILSVVGRFAQFIPTCLAVLVLRRRDTEAPAFRIPLGATVPVLALLLCAWLLSQAEATQMFWGGVAIAAGGAIYLLGRRARPDRPA